jgi:hypothetical protein
LVDLVSFRTWEIKGGRVHMGSLPGRMLRPFGLQRRPGGACLKRRIRGCGAIVGDCDRFELQASLDDPWLATIA